MSSSDIVYGNISLVLVGAAFGEDDGAELPPRSIMPGGEAQNL
jgi:hypothetical protein